MRDAILRRVSTRTYKKEILSNDEVSNILSIIDKYNKIKGPFGNSFDFSFTLNNSNDENGKKIGTYGLIKNVPAFIGGTSNNSFESIVDFGYVLEYIILELTKFDFDTCWLGGTFNRKDYKRDLQKDEIIPAITPVGHRGDKRSLVDKAIRTGAESANRLPISEIFCYYNEEKEMVLEPDNPILSSLSLVRRGPSASNKQPWRIRVDKDKVHFYIKRTPNYPGVSLGYDIQALDIGIALCHYEVGMNYFEKKLEYLQEDNLNTIDNCIYVISVKTKT